MLKRLIRLTIFYFYKCLGINLPIIVINGLKMALDNKNIGISRTLFLNRVREVDQTALLLENLQPGMKCLDLGANIGYYTLLSANQVGPSGKVFAFEPDYRNLPILKRNVSLNHFDQRVKIFESAIGHTNSRINFIHSNKTNLSHVNLAFDLAIKNVDLRSLVDLQPEIGLVDTIRMDIEGFEVFVLSIDNLNYLKNLQMNSTIFFEVHPEKYIESNDYNFDATVETLIKSDFNDFSVVSSGKSYAEIYKKLKLTPERSFDEKPWKRFLFKNVGSENFKILCKTVPKVVRYGIVKKL